MEFKNIYQTMDSFFFSSLENEPFFDSLEQNSSKGLRDEIEFVFDKEYQDNITDINEKIFAQKIEEKEKEEEINSNDYMRISENGKTKEKINEEKNYLNKKTKSTGTNTKKEKTYTKFDDENMRRKCKHIILDATLNFTNKKICELNNNNIGKGIRIKQLQTLNQKQRSESNIQFNKDFLNKTLREIFSDEISSKITSFSPYHNKELIEMLLNENNICKRNYYNKLFSLTFLQCLEHFRGTNFYEELNGMDTMEMKLIKIDDEEYKKGLEYYLNNYETILKNKRSRKPKKEKKNK